MPSKNRYFDFKIQRSLDRILHIESRHVDRGAKHTLDARLYYTAAEATEYLSGLTQAQNRLYFTNELF